VYPSIATVLKNATKTYYNNVTADYDNLYHDFISGAEDDLVSKLTSKFLQHSSQPENVLDLGSGTGFGYQVVPAKRYVGVDISFEMVKKAKKLHPNAQFLNEDFDKIKLEPNSFDNMVSFYGSLSHSTDINNLVAEVYQALKPGGKFIFMFYSQYSLRNILSSLFHLNPEYISSFRPYKIRNYSKGEPPAIPVYFYSAPKLKKLFKEFNNVRIFGLTYFPEVPLVKKVFQLNRSLTKKFLNLEFQTLGKLFPSLGYSLIVVGEKPSQDAS